LHKNLKEGLVELGHDVTVDTPYTQLGRNFKECTQRVYI